MNLWKSLHLGTAGRPRLDHSDEKILYVQGGVGIYGQKDKLEGLQNGVTYLTSHRICYVDSARPLLNSVSLELELVGRIELQNRFIKSSPKIILELKDKQRAEKPSAREVLWICPICSFANRTTKSPFEACLSCGVLPSKETMDKYESNLVEPKPDLKTTAAKSGLFQCPRCTFLNHPALATCEICGEPLVSSHLPPSLSKPLLSDIEINNEIMYKLSFRQGGEKQFYERLDSALKSEAWKQSKKDVKQDNSLLVSRSVGAGIGGLERQGEAIRIQHDATIGVAFDDLEALMSRAKEMVALAESFATKLATSPSSAMSEEGNRALRQSKEALGLSSIVTRDVAGSGDTYHIELARQLAEFLQKGTLAREGGIMTMFDLYAMYNKALGHGKHLFATH